MRRGYDRVSLAAGMVITLLGALLVLDRAGVLELSAGWVGAAVAASAGTILLVSGLFDRQP